VVGAGPTGLVLACDLVRRGVRTLVVEQCPALFPGSRGKVLQPRTQEVFDDLGVMDEVRAAGGPFPAMLRWRGDRREESWELGGGPAGEVSGTPYPSMWMIPQWRTQEILLARLRALGGDVRFETVLTGLSQDGRGVTARLEGPGAGGGEVRAGYLVGADGGRSTVREEIGVGMRGEAVDSQPSVVADLRISGLDREHWHVWPKAPGGPLMLCPLPGTDLFQLVARSSDGPVDVSADSVRATIAARTPLAAETLGEVVWASGYRTRVALADRYRADRVFLAGDSAHIHSPAGGQGLNTGVQDAYNLGWKLGRVLRCGAGTALLDSYEPERRPVAADVLGLSTRIHAVGAMSGVPGRNREETSQLDVGYPDSPLSVEARPHLLPKSLRAGDRVPDAVLDGGGRLFGLLRGPHATLLAVGQPAPSLAAPDLAVRELPALPELGPGLFLVRPDGYLGLATSSAGDVGDYLRMIGNRHDGAGGTASPAP